MSDKMNGQGYLVFEGTGFRDRVKVQWGLVDGDRIAQGASWRAVITFFAHPVPENVTSSIFIALSNSSVIMKLQMDEDTIVDCHICEILDLPDSGSIEISSLDRPGAKIIWGNGPQLSYPPTG